MMNSEQQKVDGLIERIERHQAALKLSDTRFVARYQRHLGSTKTWRERLCGRAWAELGRNLPKWESKLTAFVAEIDGTSDLTDYFEDLPIARYGQSLYDQLQGQKSDRRCAWLIGPTGVGKSLTMRTLSISNPTATAYIHASRTWKDSMLQIARGFARSIGATEETGGAATFNNVAENLKAHPITLIIDDLHEGGVLLLKLVKHLVDDTHAKFILGTYPTAWGQLVNGSTEAHAEAQQLLGRSLKPINTTWMRGVSVGDVAAYLKLTLGGTPSTGSGRAGECKVLAEKIVPRLQRHGNMRALADAIELARMNADSTDEDVGFDLVESAVAELCPVEKR